MEYTTLGKCASELGAALESESEIKKITEFLFGEGCIGDNLYKELLDPKSTYSSAEKATKLVLQVIRKVKIEPSNYYKLINHLRQAKRKYQSDIVDLIDAEYFGIRKLPASGLPDQRATGKHCLLAWQLDC